MKWEIAVYLRLSKEDGDKDESDSISSQRSIITKFIKEKIKDGSIVEEYVDDGYTGTNFKRPQFQKMIEDIDSEKINCVIVKDLSRFGRDYIGVGEYLENYFPLNDIRFIAINDGYDTMTSTSNDEFIMPIKNIFNAQYSKDISKKVKSSFRTLQSEGKFVGAFACYGYAKDDEDRHKLIIDEAAAKTVRRIFDMFISGMGKISIARRLNEENIPCPSEYKKINGMNYTNGQRLELTKYWTYSAIHNILTNEMYTGNMVQNKYGRKTVRGKAKKNDKENWITVKGTHAPIILEEKWNTAQELLKRNTRQMSFDSNVGAFAGYIYCGDCGRAMSKIVNKYKSKTSTTYICGSYKRYGADTCTRHAIKLEDLEEIVLNKLNEQIAKAGEIEYTPGKEKQKQADTKKYELQLKKIYNLKKSLYEDYKGGLLSEEEYISYKEDYTKEEDMLKGQIAFIEKREEKSEKEVKWIKTLLKYKKVNELDREIIAEVLDKIIVKETEDALEVEVRFKIELL